MQNLTPTSNIGPRASIESPAPRDLGRRNERPSLGAYKKALISRQDVLLQPPPNQRPEDGLRKINPLNSDGERRPPVALSRSQVLRTAAGTSIFFLVSERAAKAAGESPAATGVSSTPAGGPFLAYVDKLLNFVVSGAALASLVTIFRTLGRIEGEIEGLATKEEMTREIANLATKEEIANLATREEMAKLATKEEIAKLATKEEMAKLATREEMAKLATKEDLSRLTGEISKLPTREDMAKLATNEALTEVAGNVAFLLGERSGRNLRELASMPELMARLARMPNLPSEGKSDPDGKKIASPDTEQ